MYSLICLAQKYKPISIAFINGGDFASSATTANLTNQYLA
jgi:hypothetical protein